MDAILVLLSTLSTSWANNKECYLSQLTFFDTKNVQKHFGHSQWTLSPARHLVRCFSRSANRPRHEHSLKQHLVGSSSISLCAALSGWYCISQVEKSYVPLWQ